MNSNFVVCAENMLKTSDKNLDGMTVASVVITGIAVVFLGLIILILLVMLYGKIFEKINASAAEKKALAEAAAAAEAAKKATETAAEKPVSAPIVEDGIDEEITAVIAAAIAAYGEQTGKKLAVRSIKSAGQYGGRNAWSAAGLSEATRPF
jgi:Na+-transporting methylmalonyl-CoA/oxaloacetate decarboxylase gamma subunit